MLYVRKMTKKRIGLQIVTSRKEYLAVLLSSLLRQTIQNWDIVLVFDDDDIMNDHAVKCLLSRMMFEGHRVKFIKVDGKGIGRLRNVALDHDDCEYGCRIDDDSWCEPNYLQKLFRVFIMEKNVGVVGGTVPFIGSELIFSPKPEKWMKVTEHGSIFDDAYLAYNCLPSEYFPADHLRSSYMYRNEVMKKVRFPEQFDKYAGFREETLPCIQLKKLGYQNFIVPSARCWHFAAPKGGCRDVWDAVGERGKWEAEELFLKEVDNVHKH